MSSDMLRFKRKRLQDLLHEVGAKITYRNQIPHLVFDPYLDSQKNDPDRWFKALQLEDAFFDFLDRSGYFKDN